MTTVSPPTTMLMGVHHRHIIKTNHEFAAKRASSATASSCGGNRQQMNPRRPRGRTAENRMI
jgi:hypothetical protein